MNRRGFILGSMAGAAGTALASASSSASAAGKAEPFQKPDCPVIDVRLRPRYPGFSEQYKLATVEACCGYAGFPVPESVKNDSQELMLKEMDEAGITVGMALKGKLTPDALVKMQKHFKGRVRSMCTLDASNPIDKNMELIEKYVVNGPFKGIYMEPGRDKVCTMPNDPKLFPLYDFCQEKGFPVGLMTGGRNSEVNFIRTTDHAAIVDIAVAFPKLKLLMSHGGWPQVEEILGVAYWYKNVYVAPDMYLFGGCHGAADFINAANTYLQDRFCFGTAYPIMPMKESVAAYRTFFPKKEIYEKVMWKNAAEFFQIDDIKA